MVPAELPKAVRKSPAFGVEVDAMPGGFVCSGSLEGHPGDDRGARGGVLGTRRISTLFSKEQRAFYAEHAPAGLELDDLAVLGPIFVLKLKFALAGYPRRLVAEMWLYPDGSRVLELSTKCAPGEAFQAAAETRALLTQRGIDLGGVQQTKTRLALDFFAARLKAAAADGRPPPTAGARPAQGRRQTLQIGPPLGTRKGQRRWTSCSSTRILPSGKANPVDTASCTLGFRCVVRAKGSHYYLPTTVERGRSRVRLAIVTQ